ncbi:MAG: hypothetical protein IID12_06260 [Candidatus Marinimicrobia bacterium]|nr:hypothetical protein [Candidatus Neomarinimicrobiota bacterium]
MNPHYISAIHTPFSFILFFEVVLLITAIPKSLTVSIGKQYEIISLITIRRVFKDIGIAENLTDLTHYVQLFKPILVDMIGGMLMFLLVAIFYRLRIKRKFLKKPDNLSQFINDKKTLAVSLIVILIALVLSNLINFSSDILHSVKEGIPFEFLGDNEFYSDFFIAMIFIDVLLLILSLAITSHYELVFRNAGFVISTIIIRLSLVSSDLNNVLLALLSMVFGICIMLIYNFITQESEANEVYKS